MISSALVQGLIDAVAHRADHPVQFWLRDDDAIEPSEPLDCLLALTETYSVPVTLAVIPALTGKALAQYLGHFHQVAVAVHGWSHVNHAPQGEKKQELGTHRPIGDILSELERGYSLLAAVHEPRFVPLLVPPWNRISPVIVERLHELGYRGLSIFGDSTAASITMINTHVDLIDWKGTRGGRDHDTLATELIEQIQSTTNPVGILTHHLVHDDGVWGFLDQLFSITNEQPGCKWVAIEQLLAAP